MACKLNYDGEKFLNDLLDFRSRGIFRILWKETPPSGYYFNAEQICDRVTRDRKQKHRAAGHFNSVGTPSRTHYQLRYLISIGCVKAHPVKGIRLDPDFCPKNQKPLIPKSE